jgi:MFS transporter, DHA1 family, multidrug resistance protein
MTLKASLVLMTVVAVVSDSMLHPFYPQYFAVVLGVTDPRHVGLYIAACSLTVMVAFPGWALLSRRFAVLRLLIATQIATAVLSIACMFLSAVVPFWIVSLAMMVFKASYLLVYPYLLSIEAEGEHIGTISLLALVVYFGNILAALLSGLVFELADPRLLFVGMASGDVLQILICWHMLRRHGFGRERAVQEAPVPASARLSRAFLVKLGLVMFVLYFSAYLTDPFFSLYWEQTSASDNRVFSGFVFAIPGLAALLGLWVNARSGGEGGQGAIVPCVLLAVGGLGLEATGQPALVLGGRFLYGWALFQAMVRLDLLLFRASRPESYALDFSKINLAQGLGVQAAALVVGSLVRSAADRLPFLVAAIGFLVGASLYLALFRAELPGPAPVTLAAPPPGAPEPWAPSIGEP